MIFRRVNVAHPHAQRRPAHDPAESKDINVRRESCRKRMANRIDLERPDLRQSQGFPVLTFQAIVVDVLDLGFSGPNPAFSGRQPPPIAVPKSA